MTYDEWLKAVRVEDMSARERDADDKAREDKRKLTQERVDPTKGTMAILEAQSSGSEHDAIYLAQLLKAAATLDAKQAAHSGGKRHSKKRRQRGGKRRSKKRRQRGGKRRSRRRRKSRRRSRR